MLRGSRHGHRRQGGGRGAEAEGDFKRGRGRQQPQGQADRSGCQPGLGPGLLEDGGRGAPIWGGGQGCAWHRRGTGNAGGREKEVSSGRQDRAVNAGLPHIRRLARGTGDTTKRCVPARWGLTLVRAATVNEATEHSPGGCVAWVWARSGPRWLTPLRGLPGATRLGGEGQVGGGRGAAPC